ncbi:hypothetical protein CesoFtcFv8_010660 [Champsocephalus esox]|uniref:Uncharacterized protein n=1 Tax=Champsocephalus esox TaxID=159716 RepID=A0AAN8C9E6_9TELE|nr:hypothetical protein CesoFtcFv8_010660 [Champsocephalus esox]
MSAPSNSLQQQLPSAPHPSHRALPAPRGGGGTTNSRGSSPPSSPSLISGSANAKQRLSPKHKDSSCPPDAITGPYLSGQWPRDSHGPYPSCMKDKPHRLRGLKREQSREVLTSGQPPGAARTTSKRLLN